MSEPYNNKFLPWTENHKITEIKESTISKIELSEKDAVRLNHVLQSNKMGQWSKDIQINKLVGKCVHCSKLPEWVITFHYDGLTKIEKYCNDCIEQEKVNINQVK